MNYATVSFTGNVVFDPEVRDTPAGKVATLKVATTERRLDRVSGQWQNGVTTFYKVTCWKTMATNVAESLRKGDPVFVSGRVVLATFERRDGTQGSALEVTADAVGPDLRRTAVEVRRRPRSEQPSVSAASPPAPSAPVSSSVVADPTDPWAADLARAAESAA